MGNGRLSEVANAIDRLIADFIYLGVEPREIAKLMKLRAEVLLQNKR